MVGRSLITSLSLVLGRCRRIMGLARAEGDGRVKRWDRLGGLFRFSVLFYYSQYGGKVGQGHIVGRLDSNHRSQSIYLKAKQIHGQCACCSFWSV